MGTKVETWLYNEQHPNGKLFNIDDDERAGLDGDGWVDSPAKVKGHPNYEGGDESEEEELAELQKITPANNMTRPAGLPEGATSSTASVNVEDIKPARKPRKTTTGEKPAGKAGKKGLTEQQLPDNPADANEDAERIGGVNSKDASVGADGEVKPLKPAGPDTNTGGAAPEGTTPNPDNAPDNK